MSSKAYREFRDPLHVFTRFDTGERSVIASEAVQRLRHIHQLAMSYLITQGRPTRGSSTRWV